jgi:hypothetical protein
LIDKTRDLGFGTKKSTKLVFIKNERPDGSFSNHRSGCRSLGQEGNFADEVALFQQRDFAPGDEDPDSTIANEEKLLKISIFLGKRRASRDLRKLTGDEQPRNLCIA